MENELETIIIGYILGLSRFRLYIGMMENQMEEKVENDLGTGFVWRLLGFYVRDVVNIRLTKGPSRVHIRVPLLV